MLRQMLRPVAVEETGSGDDIRVHIPVFPNPIFSTGSKRLTLIMVDEEPFIQRWREIRHAARNGSYTLHDHIRVRGMQPASMCDKRRADHYLRSTAMNFVNRKG